ncbi:AcrR family transcriptional regulator [Arthrobacter sp. CAN_A212]|uniref:TetR/AcrR family transcriptional regulator n=1 Tax=Arthrobacter sp. CAN_A212 TaxID=2787719 RepID=UPI0018CBEB26
MTENTRSAICDTARRLTIDKGLSGFTVEELCEQVGISRRTFFNYFPPRKTRCLATARTISQKT